MKRFIAVLFFAATLSAHADDVALIVELQAPPRTQAATDALSRFRRDFAALHRQSNKTGSDATPAIRYEYSLAYVGVALTVPAADVDRIRALPGVRAVHRDEVMHALADGPVEDAGKRINAASLGVRGQGIKVAIIDSGIDYRHEAFGNGFGPGHKVAGGWDFVNNDADPIDDAGHGTHVAGIVAADMPGLIGVAPDATLLAYKVLSAIGLGQESGVIAAIERALADHADVMNFSIGGLGNPDDPVSTAVDNAVAAGAIVVVSAGNSGSAMTITSPGTARRAITVGASDYRGEVAAFSSKGPTAKFFTFKPDIIAPGEQIISAKRGGGTVALSGTSMAAPHVAGAAALLKQLHRDWTPSQIRSALTSTATAMSSSPWTRGAGKIDAAPAAQARLFTSETGISFGINSPNTGTWSESRTVKVTNGGSAADTIRITAAVRPAADGKSANVTISATPSEVTLQPGETADVTLTASADNATLLYPADFTVFGDITLAGSRSITIPWAVLRAAVLRVHYELLKDEWAELRIYGTEVYDAVMTDEDQHEAEVVLAPGTYDVVAMTLLQPPNPEPAKTLRFLIAENVNVAGEQTVELRRDMPQHHVVLDGRDDQNRPLASLPRDYPRRLSFTVVRIRNTGHIPTFSLDTTETKSLASPLLTDVYFTPAGARFELTTSQVYVDLETMHAYSVQHPLISPLDHGGTLTNSPSSFVHATVALKHAPSLAPNATACVANSSTRPSGADILVWPCTTTEVARDDAKFEVFATPDVTPNAHVAWVLGTGATETQPLRAFGQTIVPSYDSIPSPVAWRIPHNGTITLGIGPLTPFDWVGTSGTTATLIPYAGLYGPYGDRHGGAGDDAYWILYDDKDNVVSTGQTGRGHRYPEAKPGHRFESIRPKLETAGRRGQATYVVQFGTGSDLLAPSITSMSIRNASGAAVDRLGNGEKATMYLSAGDYTYGIYARYNHIETGAVHVSYRVNGTKEWTPLTLTFAGDDIGDRAVTGHWPTGRAFTADLSGATAHPDSAIDLKFELSDPAGNRATWTQERAFDVGNVPPPPGPGPRRRPAK